MKNITLKNNTITLDNIEEVTIDVEEYDNKIYIVNNSVSLNITINMQPNSSLKVYDFNLNDKTQNITINHTHDSKFEYYHTFKTIGKYNINYLANLNGDNNENNIYLRGVSLDDNYINVDGQVKEHSKGNVLNEDLRILNIGGHAYVSPMLHVNALDVIANHNTAISNVREDELFYLMSKGISKDKCIELISDGYLYGIFKNEEEFYKNIK